MVAEEGGLNGALRAPKAEDATLDEVSALVRKLVQEFLASGLAAAGLDESPEVLRQEERLLLKRREELEARLAEVRRKLELVASVRAEVEQRLRK